MWYGALKTELLCLRSRTRFCCKDNSAISLAFSAMMARSDNILQNNVGRDVALTPGKSQDPPQPLPNHCILTHSINRPRNPPGRSKLLAQCTSNPHCEPSHRIHPLTPKLHHPPQPRNFQQLLQHALNKLSIQPATRGHEIQMGNAPSDPERPFC